MTDISFEILYSEDNQSAHAALLAWANFFGEGLEYRFQFDDDSVWQFVTNLQKGDLPANGGFEAASPFKKAAGIYIWLHQASPFKGALPQEKFGEELSDLGSLGVNGLIGLGIVSTCLTGAKISKDGNEHEISNSINFSKHFMVDLIEASRGITPIDSFKTYSVLFEALVYQTNPELSYPHLF